MKPDKLTEVKMKQPKVRSISILYLLIFICGIALIFWVFHSTPTAKPAEIPISQVVTMSQANQIKSLVVQGQNISVVGTDDTKYTSFLPDNVNNYDVKDLNLTDVEVKFSIWRNEKVSHDLQIHHGIDTITIENLETKELEDLKKIIELHLAGLKRKRK